MTTTRAQKRLYEYLVVEEGINQNHDSSNNENIDNTGNIQNIDLCKYAFYKIKLNPF